MRSGGELPVVTVRGLEKHFSIHTGFFNRKVGVIKAVDGVNFDIMPGSSLGLVGESGSGKTTTGKLLVRLLEPTAGSISIQTPEGTAADIAPYKGKALKAFRRYAQIIFQDPYESLNPRHTVARIVTEPLAVQRIGSKAERLEKAREMLRLVDLRPVDSFLERRPPELSGGQRQRVAIARTLSLEPQFIVADEPTSMLDVSVRIGLMDLLNSLSSRFGVSLLYITHDLAIARHMCQQIAVMYTGKIVEQAETEELLANALHPYTRALLAATPSPDAQPGEDLIEIKDGTSRAYNPPPNCRFYSRCPIADDYCRDAPHPGLEDRGDGHLVACYKA